MRQFSLATTCAAAAILSSLALSTTALAQSAAQARTSSSAQNSSREQAPREQARPERVALSESRLLLARLPLREGAGPVTHAVTRHDDWALACEQRTTERTCFASTFVEVGGLELKLKVGYAGTGAIMRREAAQPPARNLRERTQEQQRRAAEEATQGPRRLVLSIEGPASLDRAVGFLVSSERFTAAARFEECIRECVSAIHLVDPAKVIDGRAAPIHVLSADGPRPMMWTVTTRGLEAAYKHLLEEMKPPQPAQPPVPADPQALFERPAIPVPNAQTGGVRTIDLSAEASRREVAARNATPQARPDANEEAEAPRPARRAAPPAQPRRSEASRPAQSDTFVPRSQ